MALSRYYFGVPFKRVETWQYLHGVPLPDATQFDQMRTLLPIVRPIYQCLQALAPEGQTLFYDDTPNRILALSKATLANNKRSGIYTTALVSQVGPYAIYLFSTGPRYARENVVPLLRTRQDPAAFLTMSDASPLNIPSAPPSDERLLARWILSFCLVHGRRKFWEVSGLYSPEADFVLTQISEVYQHERHCRQARLADVQRLTYHQAHSGPLLQALHVWLTAKLQFYEVEPNSGLGQAMAYLLRHWVSLTRFLQVPGAPLDNSLCERAIKVIIRHRRNSQGFRTLFGAQVGDGLMSVIHTAVMNQANRHLAKP
jgi:transposase